MSTIKGHSLVRPRVTGLAGLAGSAGSGLFIVLGAFI
jgi:hypothetical protein